MIVQKTLNMANATGYVLTLAPSSGFSMVQLKAAVACVVKTVSYSAVDAAPTAPVADPSPSAGLSASWYRMSANEVLRVGYEAPKGALDSSYNDAIQYVVVWALAAGELDIVAH